MTLQHLKRLWQPRRGLFWQMLIFNGLSSACGWALNTMSLNAVGQLLIGAVGLLNVAFGLAAAWALMRDDTYDSPAARDDTR
jgi:hypothetical protein